MGLLTRTWTRSSAGISSSVLGFLAQRHPKGQSRSPRQGRPGEAVAQQFVFTATVLRRRPWWFTFAILAAAGLAAGLWLAFSFEYQVSPRMRYVSFQIPLAFFHLEDGRWVDFVTPPYVLYPGLVAYVGAVIALALLPLLVASAAFGRKGGGHETDADQPSGRTEIRGRVSGDD